MNLLHHDKHPSLSFVHFSHFNNIWVAKQTHDLDLIPQKLFFALVQFRFINLFKSI